MGVVVGPVAALLLAREVGYTSAGTVELDGRLRPELAERLKELVMEGKLLEAQRLEQRTNFDLEMIAATGSCAGIENYSRFLTGRLPGEPPPTLFEYLPENALLFVDESHQTIGQINGMSRGDHRRKITLAEYGFRLPSAIDNRPLKFAEVLERVPRLVMVSATPGEVEKGETARMVDEVGGQTGVGAASRGSARVGRRTGRRRKKYVTGTM